MYILGADGGRIVNPEEIKSLYHFSGRTYVVTGGTGVLGGEVVCALEALGANVVMLDRNVDAAQPLMERMGPQACNAVRLTETS